MSATFLINRLAGNEYEFLLVGPDDLPLVTSGRYAHRTGALKGIHSVRVNSQFNERYLRNGGDGEYYFVLTSGNRQVIVHSPMFTTGAAMEAAISAVIQYAPSAPVADAMGA